MQKINLDSVFKNAREIVQEVAEQKNLLRQIGALLLLIFACGGAYGLTMGIAHSYLQMLSSFFKVPLLYILTLLITLPTLHFIGLFLGSRIGFLQSATLLLLGMAVNSVLLLGFATISLFFFLTGSSYRFLLLMHVLFFLVSGLAGLISIRRSFRQLSETTETGKSTGRFNLLQIWMLLYMFVGTQMAYILSPFVGRESEFYLFHHAKGNFYSYVWEAMIEKAGGRPSSEDAEQLAAERSKAVLLSLKHQDYDRLAHLVHPDKGLRFILKGIPMPPLAADRDPAFLPKGLEDAAEKNEPVILKVERDYGSKQTNTESLPFRSFMEQRVYIEDFASVDTSAKFNEFSHGREHKDVLYRAFEDAIFVEFTVSKEDGSWKVMRLVFEPMYAGVQDDYRLVAVIIDRSEF